MKLRYTILILGTLFSFCQISAQEAKSSKRILYEITNDQAKAFFKDGRIKHLDSTHFIRPVDSLYLYDRSWKTERGKYYLETDVRDNYLNSRLVHKPLISIFQLESKKGIQFQITDSLGQTLKNAKVFLDKKEVKYSSKTNSYERRRWNKKDGKLIVENDGYLAFFEIKNNKNWRYRAPLGRRLKSIALSPYYFSRKHLTRISRYVFSKDYRENRSRVKRKYKGYFAFNKPKYRPGDTVKVKGYFTIKNKKALEVPLEFQLIGNSGKKAISKFIEANSPGNYTTEFVLHDSLDLRLNRQYHVYVYEKYKNKSRRVYHAYFRYEDYQLNEMVYDLSTKQKGYSRGDTVTVDLKASYKNGLSAPDAKVKLVVKSNVKQSYFSHDKFYEEIVYVPDTLWTKEQNLNSKGLAEITLPDSIFPALELPIEVEAYFSNSNGELHQEKLKFVYGKPPFTCLDLKLEGEWLVAKCIGQDSLNMKKAFLNYFNESTEITLPHKQRVNGFHTNYELSVDGKSRAALLELKNHSSLVEVNGSNKYDSLKINISNPRRINIYYELYAGKKLIGKGESEELEFLFERNSNAGTYTFYYEYYWNGRLIQNESPFIHFNKKLNIDIDQPAIVSPGQKVPIKVRVTNEKQKPVANVNLTLGAVNGQFENSNSYTAPKLSYKISKNPKKKNNTTSKRWSTTGNSSQLNRALLKRYEVEEKTYYKLRFPKNGYYFHSDSITVQDSFYQELAQFSPFLVRKGNLVPIYLIFCNRELVYYHGTDDQLPYSFIGQDGYNTIEIRTYDATYKIDSVQLKDGHKLDFSIDLDKYESTGLAWDLDIQKSHQPSAWTAQEKKLIKNSIFIFKPSMVGVHQIFQGNKVSILKSQNPRYRNSNQKNLFLGPFNTRNNLSYIARDGFSNFFTFEPEFIYSISPARERLYHYPWKELEVKKLKRFNEPKKFGKLVASPAQVKAYSLIEQAFSFQPNSVGTQRGNGTFQYQLETKTVLLGTAIRRIGEEFSIYDPKTTLIHNLTPGAYEVVLIGAKGKYFLFPIEIRKNTLTFRQLKEPVFQEDENLDLYKQIIDETKTVDPNKGKDLSQIINKGKEPASVNYNYGSNDISGLLTDENGEGLIGVSVVVKGTTIGTSTDIDGTFTLKVPYGSYQLTFAYLGYQSQEINVEAGMRDVEVVLAEEKMLLDEVVVVGASRISQKTKSSAMTISSQEINNLPTRNIHAIAGKVAGLSTSFDSRGEIKIRGARSGATLYIIDGIPVTQADFEKLNQKDIKKIDYLDKNQVQLKFGENADNGALIAFTFNRKNQDLDLEPGIQLRRNFKDYAFWQPNLVTDKNGESEFEVILPDNTTEWKTFALAMNRKQYAGVANASSLAYKKLMATLSLPRFLIEGDRTDVVGKTLNYTEDSLRIQTTFKRGEEILKSQTSIVGEALIEKMNLQAEESLDSLELTYSLLFEEPGSGAYGDGELRKIPVLPKGVEEVIGGFYVLDKDTSFTLSFDPQYGPVKVHGELNFLNLMKESLFYLRTYPYGCNEQMASKLMANLLHKKLRTAEGKTVDNEKFILKGIQKLTQNQNGDGSYGWWQNGRRNLWMTTYVLRALHMAKGMGYKVPAFEKGLKFLTNSLDEMKPRDLLDALELLAEIEQNMDYQAQLTVLDSILKKPSLHEKFTMIKIRQAAKLPYSLDSLTKTMKTTLLGEKYWTGEKYHWYNTNIQLSTLAFEIFNKAGESDTASKIKLYILRNRYHRRWGNTYQTTKVLLALLDTEFGSVDLTKKSSSVKVNNKLLFQNGRVREDFSVTNNEKITIENKGKGISYLTCYQEYWNPNPEPLEKYFTVKSRLIQKEKTTEHLVAAEPTIMEVTVDVERSAEYVMIEVPIPAGCSYDKDKNARYPRRRYSNHEVHREYFKNKVAIFCERLPEGKHTYTFHLQPRYTGQYTLNPARIEEMYFPVFYGNNELKEVEILEE